MGEDRTGAESESKHGKAINYAGLLDPGRFGNFLNLEDSVFAYLRLYNLL